MRSSPNSTQEMFGFSYKIVAVKELFCIVPLFLFVFYTFRIPSAGQAAAQRVGALLFFIAFQLVLFRNMFRFATLGEETVNCLDMDLFRFGKLIDSVEIPFEQIYRTEVRQNSWQRLLRIGGDVVLHTGLPGRQEVVVKNVQDPQRFLDLIQAGKAKR